MKPISKNQIKLIHTAKSQLGLDDNLYRDILLNLFGVSSSTELSVRQGIELIEYFRKHGFVLQKDRERKNIIRLVTPAQRRLINVLSSRFPWKYKNGFELWLRRQQEKGYIRSAALNEFADAAWVIEKLKQMTGTTTGNIINREVPHEVE